MSEIPIALAEDGESLVAAMTEALGAEEIFVLSHDLTQLRPLGPNGTTPLTDEHLLDAILGGSRYTVDNRIYVPVPSRLYPMVVAEMQSGAPLEDQDLAVLGALADHHRSFLDIIEHRRRSNRFSPAAELQWSLLPLKAAQTKGLEVAGVLQPASTVAGDAYDFAVTPDGSLAVYVLDAMGHGVTATLSSSLAIATIRTVRRSGGGLIDQVAAADEAVLAEFGGDRFVTMAALLNGPDGIEVINAGHEPILRLDAMNVVETLDLRADPPLGLGVDPTYHVHQVKALAPGEALVLLSDGASEARNPDGMIFGSEGVARTLAELRGANSLQTANRFGRAVVRYVDGELIDDLTTVVVQRVS